LMDRRTFLAGTGAALLAAPLASEAQPAKTARLGTLSLAAGPNPTMDVFLGLRELGWVEGHNLVVDQRWAAGREEELPALAAELVRLKPDVIVTLTTLAARAAKQATTTIPIVFTFVADPVGSDLVASLARPGGNITGVTTLAAGLVAKRMELLKAMVPQARRMAVLWQPGGFGEETAQNMRQEIDVAARAMKAQIRFIEARRPEDLEAAFVSIREARVGALPPCLSEPYGVRGAGTGCGARDQEPPADDVSLAGGSGGRRLSVLLDELPRHVPPCRCLRGQDSQRCQAGRPPRRAAHQVRVGDQPQDRQGARPDDPAVAARTSGPGNRVSGD